MTNLKDLSTHCEEKETFLTSEYFFSLSETQSDFYGNLRFLKSLDDGLL